MKESNFHETLERPKKFDWRMYLKNPSEMPKDLAAKLDELSDMVNQEGEESTEFISMLEKGQLKEPVQALVNFFRDILVGADEKKELSDAIEKCGPKGYIPAGANFVTPESWKSNK